MIDLVATSKVYDRLSLPVDDGVTKSIKSCREGAYHYLSAVLSTSFERVVGAADTFFVNTATGVAVSGMYILRLRNGFLTAAPSVVIGDSVESLSTGSGYTGFMEANLEKGLVYLPVDAVALKFVKVTYTCGFSEASQVPPWLNEAALLMTIKTMAQQQISDAKPELSAMLPHVDKQLDFILTPKMRVANGSIRAAVR